jgi:hypothetical protein
MRALKILNSSCWSIDLVVVQWNVWLDLYIRWLYFTIGEELNQNWFPCPHIVLSNEWIKSKTRLFDPPQQPLTEHNTYVTVSTKTQYMLFIVCIFCCWSLNFSLAPYRSIFINFSSVGYYDWFGSIVLEQDQGNVNNSGSNSVFY